MTQDRGKELRRIAISLIADDYLISDQALLVLAEYGDEWKLFSEWNGIADDAWFVWRDPESPNEHPHVDQAITEGGRIVGKHRCGLNYYPECQPCTFGEDVLEAIAKGEIIRRKI